MTILHRCILADPPWPERGGGQIKRGADRHYPVLEIPEMAKVMIRSGVAPAPDAHLWMWVTNNHLEDGLGVMRALGFEYISNVAWVKARGVDDELRLQIGLGQYLRGSHELLLFGSRGHAQLPDVAPPSVIIAPRGEHSRKPDEQYALIEQVSPGPRIEMFARRRRPGWDAWGNEV